ncbi:MAG TPA: AI-2E family transporter [Hyphomicrobiaceae bacterium]|nr:AI-2E family transporter [Hyphomicrobiaceae bacterium]
MANDDNSAPRPPLRTNRHLTFWLIAAMLFLGLVWLLNDILLPFVVGAAIAFFLNPLADRLAQTGMGRTAASALIIIVAALTLVLLLILLGPLVADQLRQLAEKLPGDIKRLLVLVEGFGRAWLGGRYDEIQASFERGLAGMAQSWTTSMGWAVQQVWDRGLALVNLLSLVLITPVVAFYLLADWPRVVSRIDDALPRDHAPTIRALAGEINDAIAAFVRGQGTICLILAVIYSVGLSLIGLRYALLIGLAVGLMSFVPVIGGALGLLLAGGVAIAQGWPDLMLLIKVVALFAATSVVDSGLLSPRIVGPRVGLHPVWLIFAVLAFGSLFGLVGVLIAVPVAAAIAVLVRFAVRLYLESEVYRGTPPPPGNEGPAA